MPAEYTKALKEPGRIGVLDTTLHNAIYDLACSFHLNYNLCNPEDPSLNFVVILIELSRALALPGKFCALLAVLGFLISHSRVCSCCNAYLGPVAARPPFTRWEK